MAPLWCLLANALLILATGQLSKRAGKKAEAVSGRNQFHPHSLSPSIGLAFPSAKNGDENLARAKVVHAKLWRQLLESAWKKYSQHLQMPEPKNQES